MNNGVLNGIVIFGEMGSGKDTFADLLAEVLPTCSLYNIGYICRELMNVATVKPEWTGKSREFGQLVAVKLREIDENILNDYTYAKSIENNTLPIIIGGRTKKDYEYWKNKGFLIVGVYVDYNTRLNRLKSRDKDFNLGSLNHMTESDVPYIIENLCDVLIDNNGDLEHLKTQTLQFIKQYVED